MAEVAGPLEEAAGYEELQAKRRSGQYNLLMGGVWAALALGRLSIDAHPFFAPALVFAAALGFLAFYSLNRNRQGWEAVFIDRRLTDWSRMRRIGTVVLAAAVLLLLVSGRGGGGPLGGLDDLTESYRWMVFAAALLLAAAIVLTRKAFGNPAMASGLALAMLMLIPIGLGWIPAGFQSVAINVAIAAPLLAFGSVGAFGPKRWLVR